MPRNIEDRDAFERGVADADANQTNGPFAATDHSTPEARSYNLGFAWAVVEAGR